MSEKQKPQNQEIVSTPESSYLDEAWSDTLVAIETKQAYEYFGTDNKKHRQQEKEAFLTGEVRNPELDYPYIDIAQLQDKEQQLLDLKEQISAKEALPAVARLYNWSINMRIAENRMVQHSALAAQAESESEKALHMRRFDRYNAFVFGEPNESIFGYYANIFRDKATEVVGDEQASDDLRLAAKEVLDLLPQEYDTDHDVVALRDQASYDELRPAVLNSFGLDAEKVADIVSAEGNLDSQDLIDFFREHDSGLPGAQEYDIAPSENHAAITFSAIRKDMAVPTTKNGEPRLFTPEQALKGHIHEYEGHLGRSANGYATKLKLMGHGFDRVSRIEEGNAMFGESFVDTAPNELTAFAGVMAIGLAKGLDTPRDVRSGDDLRDFRDTNEALQKIYRFKALLDGKSMADADASAQTLAWGRSVRTFRGSTCDSPGSVLLKDYSYGEGFLETHLFVSEDTDRLGLLRFGRIDPMQERHLAALVELEIMPEDLQDLEQE